MNIHILLLLLFLSLELHDEGKGAREKKRAQRAVSIFTHSSIPASDCIDVELEPFCASAEGFSTHGESERRKTLHSLSLSLSPSVTLEERSMLNTGQERDCLFCSSRTMMTMTRFISDESLLCLASCRHPSRSVCFSRRHSSQSFSTRRFSTERLSSTSD